MFTHVIDDRSSATAYYELGLLGDPDGSGTDVQHTLAVSASRSFPGHLGAYVELARIDGPGGYEPLLATIGGTRSLSPTSRSTSAS